ncbi:MAG: 4-alpha-glucanotransferase [Rhodothermales bacterium]
MASRSSGLLLHVTSLPSPFGIGDFGPGAVRFIDTLAEAGQTVWQVLPLTPVGHGHSPYASPSTFAGNPLLISPERLADAGWLEPDELEDAPDFPTDHVDFDRVIPFKAALLRRAFERARQVGFSADYRAFCAREAHWLDDYALFTALKAHHDDVAWTDWPAPLARRNADALDAARAEHADAIEQHRFAQFVFAEQWEALRAHARERGVQVFGDLPIYVAHDSADVWASPHLFHLDPDGLPTAVAGVPPDYFSATGQRWGNPLYRWDRMRAHGYAWWTARLARALALVDLVRLDHFRGFEAFWAIPADEKTAVNGQWVDGPGADLFRAFEREIGTPLPLVAEDLGLITPSVRALMAEFDLPGMVVLQFAFGDPESEYLPHHYQRALAGYTGTHDNDTVVGWWDGLADADRAFARRYLGLDWSSEPIHWAAVRAVMASVVERAVFPVQDVLGLGGEARMNVPGREDGNWAWRFAWDAVDDETITRLRDLTETYGRASASSPLPGDDAKADAAPTSLSATSPS